MFGSEAIAGNRYVLGNLIGRGRMAEVFVGHVNGLHGFKKPVAIKRLLPALANDRVFVDRLIAEAKVLVGLHHGNIVGVLDLAHDDNNVFIVMEHVDGPSLRQFLHARGPRLLPLGIATYIVQSAAAGLEFAHTLATGGIVHADISPSSLLLTASGEVRVADFGIALRDGSMGGGTWTYTPPEQLRGAPLSRASDVFALGAVLYELLTGRYPFASARREHAEIAPPRTINPSVPASLDAICMRALAEDPCDRFGRMQHVIDALVDVRFDQQWRDGPNELAREIRNIGAAQEKTLVTSRSTAVITRSLIAQASPEVAPPAHGVASSEQTVIVDMTPIPATGLPVETPAVAIDDQYGRARWTDAKRNPLHMFAAWLPAPELSTIHSRHDVPATLRRSVIRAMRGDWRIFAIAIAASALVGIVVFFVMRAKLAVGSPEAVVSAARRMRVGETHVVAPRPLFHIAMPSPDPAHLADASTPPQPRKTIVAAEAVSRDNTTMPAVDASPTGTPHLRKTVFVDADAASRDNTTSPAADASPAGTTHPGKAVVAADAMLRVNTIGPDSVWAFASLDGVRKEVPGAKFKATPGRHVVKLENPSLDLELSCVVTLVARRTASLDVDLQTGRCRVSAPH